MLLSRKRFFYAMMIKKISERILNGGSISESEALELSKVDDKKSLYEAADTIRQHYKGNAMEMCSIVNAKSGKCTQDCKWCSQSRHNNSKVDEYELIDLKQAEDEAIVNASKGVHRFSLVTSGRSISNSHLDKLCQVYDSIRAKSDIHLCASMGLLNRQQLLKLKDSGVEHYHCNIETAPSFFSKLVSTHTMEDKTKTIKIAQDIGMRICSGGIIGMGESMEQRIEMAFVLSELSVDSIPINILMPVEGTSLEHALPLSDEEVLTTFALFRFINPKADVRLAGGRKLLQHIQPDILKAGVSAALVGDYLTTLGTNIDQDRQEFIKAGLSVNI